MRKQNNSGKLKIISSQFQNNAVNNVKKNSLSNGINYSKRINNKPIISIRSMKVKRLIAAQGECKYCKDKQ